MLLVYAVGTLLVGKYRIERVLGQGGMGVVVAATHVQLNQPVALKFLLDEMLGQPEIVERFLREARASAALRGEHVCRVSDVGTLESGAPYIVMELLSGRDLSTFLSSGGALPVGLVADYVQQACLGLAEAHAQGIIHRDLKPANLFLTQRPDGTPVIKILDFGIAKAQSDNVKLTRTAAVMGSPGYMSPEQLRSARNVDARSDIWSLGVILYELASGRLPFQADTLTEMVLRVGMDPTPPLTGQSLPAGFDAVVYRCLEKDPNYRFKDVAQFARALAPYAGQRGSDMAGSVARVLSVTDQTALPSVQGSSAPTTLSAAAGAVSRPPRRSATWIAAVASVMVVGGIIAFALHGDQSSGPESRPPAAITPTAVPAPPMVAPARPPTVAPARPPTVASAPPPIATAPGSATTAPGSAAQVAGSAALSPPTPPATAATVHVHSPARGRTSKPKPPAPSNPTVRWDNSRY